MGVGWILLKADEVRIHVTDLEGLTLWWGLVGPRQGIGWGCGRCRRIALEAEGAEDLGEPGAEGGVGEDFKQIAVVGEPQVLGGAEIRDGAGKATASVPVPIDMLCVPSIWSVGKSSLRSAAVSGSSASSGVMNISKPTWSYGF